MAQGLGAFALLLTTLLSVVSASALLPGPRVVPKVPKVPISIQFSNIIGLGRSAQRRGDNILPSSDLSHPDRKIWIITTASLPWMTGTAVNPLLRAAYLSRGRPAGRVTLVLPWLEEDDQKVVYPHKKVFKSPDEQETYIREWLSQRAGLGQESKDLRIKFYNGKYHPELGSIFSMGDVPALIPDDEADALILEEPEHLNWYRAPGVPWTSKFQHVVGICHTNYLVYSKSIQGGSMKAAFLFFMNQWMCRAYCHKVIKLSAALQRFAPGKEEVENVHGVRREFLDVGDHVKPHALEGAYFIGKMLWAKGLDRLIPLMEYARDRNGRDFKIDCHGSGPDEADIKRKAETKNLSIVFHPGVDHATLTNYKVFINPSISEVLCTTVAEALAMGKFVICADHPSNEFFMQFTNCLTFRNKEEFATQVLWALAHVPAKLSPEERDMLSWEAATRRLLKASLVPHGTDAHSKLDKTLVSAHNWVSYGKRGDKLRRLAGGEIFAAELQPGPTHAGDVILNNEERIVAEERRREGPPPSLLGPMPKIGLKGGEGKLLSTLSSTTMASAVGAASQQKAQQQQQQHCCTNADCEAVAGVMEGTAAIATAAVAEAARGGATVGEEGSCRGKTTIGASSSSKTGSSSDSKL